ncbi:MAG: CDP-diacylglycerol--glycerol-3-phosphate 3-phosphatidyltransferase [Actinobacteria bacterium]|nr:CDP-diacylglycerol--glycerol-3-phosphate 3-phosphatidyltransferase [Actinomycetota bacterium]
MTWTWLGRLPNVLTASRVLTIPLIVWLLYSEWDFSNQLAALVFGAAGFSDVFDGMLARRFKTGSQLGIFVDLVGDKLLVTTLLVAFVDLGWIPVWFAAVIIGREFVVMGLRAYAGAQGVAVTAGPLGKNKMTWQYIGLNALMWERSALGWELAVIASILTVVSGAHYAFSIWRMIRARPVPAVPEAF